MLAAVGFAALAIGNASPLSAQTTRAFTACTQGALANCSVLRLTSQLGAGDSGLNLFEIAIRNLGSQTTPSLATSIYNLVLFTGETAAVGEEIIAAPAPIAEGGANVSDATVWDVFDSGDAIFLSALSGNGVGNCVFAGAIGGFSQAGNTCGNDSQFLAFSFSTTRAYDVSLFSLANLEVVALNEELIGDSCGGDDRPCAIAAAPPLTAVPEPGTMMLALTGLSGLAGMRMRLRRRASATTPA